MNTNFKINFDYFGTFSREAMRILKFMVEKWPKKKTFNTDELGSVINLKDRALGGVLGSFSKRAGDPLVIKAGTISIGWQGQKFSRSKQVWAIHPKLKENQIKEIKDILSLMPLG